MIPPHSHTSTLCFIHMFSLPFTLSLKAPSPSLAPMLRAGGVEVGRGQDELSGTTLQPLRHYPTASQGLMAVRQGPIAEGVVRLGSWIPDPAWKERRKVGHGGLTFRPRDPCSPAGPSGPRGPWNRKKGLAQWTAGVSLGLGTRRQGCPEPWGFPCTSLGLLLPLTWEGAPSSSL